MGQGVFIVLLCLRLQHDMRASDLSRVCLPPPTKNVSFCDQAHVYNTFQKDPVKYERYETATAAALADRDTDTVHTVMVLGAGQGPLVQRALQAAETAGTAFRVRLCLCLCVRARAYRLVWGDAPASFLR